MNKIKIIATLVMLAIATNISAQNVSMLAPFTAYKMINLSEYKSDTIENTMHFIINVKSKEMLFASESESEYSEQIMDIDTCQSGKTRCIQIWTEHSYYEIKQYLRGQSRIYRPFMVVEYPYIGDIDRRIWMK